MSVIRPAVVRRRKHCTNPLRVSSQTHRPPLTPASALSHELVGELRYAPLHPPGMNQTRVQRSVYDSLRQRMLEDMQVRNLSPNTQRAYVESVARIARHCGRSPVDLGPEEIRAYQVYLIRERHLAPSSLEIAVCALRFLCKVTLKQPWSFDDLIPAPKKPRRLPVVLSPDEVSIAETRGLDRRRHSRPTHHIARGALHRQRSTPASALRRRDGSRHHPVLPVARNSIPIADRLCSGFVQSVFRSPARRTHRLSRFQRSSAAPLTEKRSGLAGSRGLTEGPLSA